MTSQNRQMEDNITATSLLEKAVTGAITGATYTLLYGLSGGAALIAIHGLMKQHPYEVACGLAAYAVCSASREVCRHAFNRDFYQPNTPDKKQKELTDRLMSPY
jgi:hypothetical protein